jgi:hypothetical protein
VTDELAQLATEERQLRQQHEIVIADCRQSQAGVAAIRASALRKLREETARRDQALASQLALAKAQLERERHRWESEEAAANAAAENLSKVKRATAKSCAERLEAAQTQITKLSAVLAAQQSGEAEDDAAARASIAKTEALARENATLAQRVKAFKEELAALKSQATAAASFLSSARTPTKKDATDDSFQTALE